jgi:hypothetical protein
MENSLGILVADVKRYKPSGYAPISYIMFKNDSDDYLE